MEKYSNHFFIFARYLFLYQVIMSKTKVAILVVFLILAIDQVVKILVKTHMHLGEFKPVFDGWFMIHYIENPGMAFGLDIPGRFGKLSLSMVRIVAIVAIIFYLRSLIQKKARTALIICISMILAGAIGNILDCSFYGLLFDKGTVYDPQIKDWIGYSGLASMNFTGYAAPFKGCVVDMLYFPLIEGTYPHWIPFKGGESFIFFRPIFNLADSAISVGVVLILLFQKRLFS